MRRLTVPNILTDTLWLTSLILQAEYYSSIIISSIMLAE